MHLIIKIANAANIAPSVFGAQCERIHIEAFKSLEEGHTSGCFISSSITAEWEITDAKERS